MTRTAVDDLFMISVADATVYDTNGSIMFTGKTNMDTNVTIKTGESEIRGGQGSQLLYVYKHTSEWSGTIQDTQFNLAMLAANMGTSVGTSANIYSEESVLLSGSPAVGAVTGTPITDNSNSVIYGWIEYADGNSEKVTFSGQNFTTVQGVAGEYCCVRYFNLNSAAKTITVKANILPKIGRIVLETQLASSASSSGGGLVGRVEIIIPRAQFGGNVNLTMKSDGVSTMPIDYKALSYKNPLDTTGGCANTEAYAYINQIIDSALWYSDLLALGIANGDFALAVAGTKTLTVYAIHKDGSVSTPLPSDLTFSSSVPGKATVSLHGGLCTGVASGTTIISCYPTAAPAYDVSVICTVS